MTEIFDLKSLSHYEISYFKNRIRHVSTPIVLLSRNERESDLRGSYVVVVIVVVTGLRPQEPRIVDEE